MYKQVTDDPAVSSDRVRRNTAVSYSSTAEIPADTGLLTEGQAAALKKLQLCLKSLLLINLTDLSRHVIRWAVVNGQTLVLIKGRHFAAWPHPALTGLVIAIPTVWAASLFARRHLTLPPVSQKNESLSLCTPPMDIPAKLYQMTH